VVFLAFVSVKVSRWEGDVKKKGASERRVKGPKGQLFPSNRQNRPEENSTAGVSNVHVTSLAVVTMSEDTYSALIIHGKSRDIINVCTMFYIPLSFTAKYLSKAAPSQRNAPC
jgi:hypothetical protein